ncbi:MULTISPECIES: hypothetical protein [Sporomusa]|jgi:hypothetical protein|uniref:Uncharacterized protein n=2 Tax=Sporomusa TaxID=2375 RepID=A0ABM9VXS2_9FIRM|nr:MULTISPECIES: hypothetical protein [Sporomusa]MCM0760133.1 hypothetical protein [Sporomusa sphaeroides DSM 2875]OLS58218.1 hypothetical protein SPSPH_17540 [Sporomusa sphaeroides DSM 2875]CVK17595.1 hypothetical protein SSPH_00229 [Sporomusa sphaeroides DSM 2875]SCM80402.1 conserved membrane hypothetical protein [uncultured Sporomusa sp.]HML31551.1 hypothetical protein [Sporomusa sphaeroides]
MYTWAALVLIILLLMGSVWLRVCRSRTLLDSAPLLEPKPSPFSTAVQDLVATAGGVYLSMVMVVSFLKLELPEKITVGILSFDPLAMTSIAMAVIQPLFSRLFGN